LVSTLASDSPYPPPFRLIWSRCCTCAFTPKSVVEPASLALNLFHSQQDPPLLWLDASALGLLCLRVLQYAGVGFVIASSGSTRQRWVLHASVGLETSGSELNMLGLDPHAAVGVFPACSCPPRILAGFALSPMLFVHPTPFVSPQPRPTVFVCHRLRRRMWSKELNTQPKIQYTAEIPMREYPQGSVHVMKRSGECG